MPPVRVFLNIRKRPPPMSEFYGDATGDVNFSAEGSIASGPVRSLNSARGLRCSRLVAFVGPPILSLAQKFSCQRGHR
jgi:hypothetical protein